MSNINPKVNPELNHIIHGTPETKNNLEAQTKANVSGVAQEQLKAAGESFRETLLRAPLITKEDAKALSKGEVKALSKKVVTALGAEKTNKASPAQRELISNIRNLPPSVVRAFSPENLSELSIKVLKELPKESIQNLTQTQHTAIAEKEDQNCYGREDPTHQEYGSVLSIYSNHQQDKMMRTEEKKYEPPEFSPGVKEPESPPASPKTVRDVENI